MRAMEICHRRHAELRMREADLVIRPRFHRIIDVLELDALRECVAAGARAVRRNVAEISAVLDGRTRDPLARQPVRCGRSYDSPALAEWPGLSPRRGPGESHR
jgi:NTE family protein